MSDAAQGAAKPAAASGRRSWFGWKLMVAVLVVIIGCGGGAYYFFGDRLGLQARRAGPPEPQLPVYAEVKPFVVSMLGSNGVTHFVQLGVNLSLSAAALNTPVSAMLPEVTDRMRMSILAFKVEDLANPAGLDKVRAALVADINGLLADRLGAEQIQHLSAGHKDAVQNIVFTTLVIE